MGERLAADLRRDVDVGLVLGLVERGLDLRGGRFGLGNSGIGLLAVPGVGPFVAAGPILAALSGAGLGGAVGGIAGALVGMGIPEVEAKHYEGKVREGNILISVHVEDGELRGKAKNVMEKAGATDVKTWSTTKAPKDDAPARTAHS